MSAASSVTRDAREAMHEVRLWAGFAYGGCVDDDHRFLSADFREVEARLARVRRLAGSMPYARRVRVEQRLSSLERRLREVHARNEERNRRWHALPRNQRIMLGIASGQVKDGADPELALAENLAIARVVGWVDTTVDEAATRQQFEFFLNLLKLDEPLEDSFALLDGLLDETATVDSAVEDGHGHLARQALAHGRVLRPRAARREARPRARRTAARRAGGVRSGQDPGSDEPPGEPASHRRAPVDVDPQHRPLVVSKAVVA